MVGLIRLDRAYLPDDSATLGKLSIDDWSCLVLENPWRANERGVSCIPEGVYRMRLRESPVVTRTSAGEYTRGWEVCDVPSRTHIMIHPGNWPKDTDGCLLVGREYGWHAVNGPMVTHSRITFADLMTRLAERDEWDIDIRATRADYP